MDEEQVLNQQAEDGGRVSLMNILYALRAHLLFILIVTVVFAAGGFAYSKIRKPVYTASVPVQFDAVVKMVDEYGQKTDENNQVASTNYIFRYIESAIGICQSGEVLDRANVYYDYYLKSGKNIDDFINELTAAYKTVKVEHREIPNYEATDSKLDECRNKWLSSGNAGTSNNSSSNSSEIRVDFSLWVKDLDGKYAKDMAYIYAFAADVSLNNILEFDNGNGNAGIINLAGSSAGISVSNDASLQKVVIIAAVMGLAISLVAVYIMNLMDNTVKSKEQLEKMSGTSVIAYIDDIAEVK